MNIIFKFDNFELGALNFNGEEFIYNSNVKEEKQAFDDTFGTLTYHLYNSKDRKSKDLFEDFEYFLLNSARSDIQKACNILESDDKWTKLCKLAKHGLSWGNYSIEIK